MKNSTYLRVANVDIWRVNGETGQISDSGIDFAEYPLITNTAKSSSEIKPTLISVDPIETLGDNQDSGFPSITAEQLEILWF